MPELFLNKYKTYKLKKEKTEADDLKIQLFKNFRSRKNILDTTNIIFQEIMSKDLGDVDYNEDEYLNLGATDYEKNNIHHFFICILCPLYIMRCFGFGSRRLFRKWKLLE